MSEGRRAGNAQRRRSTSSSGEDRSPFVLRSGPRRAFDRFRIRTTSSPARFAVVVFVALILLFTGTALAAGRDELGPAGSRSPTRVFTAVSTICVTGPVAPSTSRPLLAVRQGRSSSRREHRRHGRAHARLDPRPRDLQAPRPAGEAHRGERHEPAARARRTRQRGPDRAPRRGRPAAAHGRPVDPRDRGASSRSLLYPSLILAGIEPARRAVGGAVLRGDGVHQHRLHAQPRRSRAVRRRLPPAHRADGGRLPRQSIGFPVIYTLWKHDWHVRRWSLHAKLTLITTVALFFAGAAAFLDPRVQQPQDLRRAGRVGHDLPGVLPLGHDPLRRLLRHRHRRAATARRSSSARMLMFVGGGSASTAGGIKVTTLAVLALAVIVRGQGPPVGRGRSAAASRATSSASPSRSSRGAPRSCALSTITIAQISQADVGGRALRRHLGVRHRRPVDRVSPRSSPTRRSTSWR